MANDSFSLRGSSDLHDDYSDLLDSINVIPKPVINRREFALIVGRPSNNDAQTLYRSLAGRRLRDVVCRHDIDSDVSEVLRGITTTRKINVMRTAHLINNSNVRRSLQFYCRNFRLNNRGEHELLRECMLIFGENLNNPAMFVLIPNSNNMDGLVADAVAAICSDAGIAVFYGGSFNSFGGLSQHIEDYVKYI